MENRTSRRAFLQKSAMATTGIALLSSPLVHAFKNQDCPFEGYNPFAEETTDLRTQTFGKYLKVSGSILDQTSQSPLPNATVEVWHLSPNSKKYRHQAKFKTDRFGNYSFYTDVPNKELGKAKRIYFRVSHDQQTYFTELIVSETGCYITSKHWEENQALGNRLFPEKSTFLNETAIQFNLSMKS